MQLQNRLSCSRDNRRALTKSISYICVAVDEWWGEDHWDQWWWNESYIGERFIRLAVTVVIPKASITDMNSKLTEIQQIVMYKCQSLIHMYKTWSKFDSPLPSLLSKHHVDYILIPRQIQLYEEKEILGESNFWQRDILFWKVYESLYYSETSSFPHLLVSVWPRRLPLSSIHQNLHSIKREDRWTFFVHCKMNNMMNTHEGRISEGSFSLAHFHMKEKRCIFLLWIFPVVQVVKGITSAVLSLSFAVRTLFIISCTLNVGNLSTWGGQGQRTVMGEREVERSVKVGASQSQFIKK